MNIPASSTSIPLTKPTFACIRCSERKVKCNKQSPCNSCVRHNLQCIFRSPKPPRKRREFVKDASVDERLKRYEALLQERGIDPNQVTSTSASEHHPRSGQSEVPETVWKLPKQATIFKPQLLHGQRELVDNSLWSRVAEEIHDGKAALEEDSTSDADDIGMPDDDFAYILGWKTPSTISRHPPAEHIHQLWQTFIENINPLTKLVHVPSLQPAIEKAIANIQHIPRGYEALMFAIYSIAVLSLTEDECSKILGETRAILLPRYVAATKAALSRARFMSSTSIIVLQALVLHILSIRDVYEPRAVWTLTGVAIRVAEGMGMGLDGTLLGLSPFETEIRRRIWWQIGLHDFRAAELCGQAKFRNFKLDETTPKKPANVNDSDLYPAMQKAATESSRPTEMIWCMFRSELIGFAASNISRIHKQGKLAFTNNEYAAMDDLKTKEIFTKELEEMYETKYLRFCDPSQPIQLMTLVGARCAMNILRFMVHHPRRWANLNQVPTSEQQLVWRIVIQILEQYKMMQSTPILRRFAWNFTYFIHWPTVIHVLDTLRADPFHPDAAKAWQLIDILFESNLEMFLTIKRPLSVAVGSLCLKAFSARVAALTKVGRSFSDPPEYITKLQEEREAAKARREAVIASGKGPEIHNGESILATTDVNVLWPGNYPVSKQLTNLAQSSTRTGDDEFWLSDALDSGLSAGGADDMMNVDIDAILAQDYCLDSPDGEVIDWAQWDAWLGNLDSVRPNIGAGPG